MKCVNSTAFCGSNRTEFHRIPDGFPGRISSNLKPHDGTNRDRAELVYRASATRSCEVGGDEAVEACRSGKTNEFRPSSPVNQEKQMSSGSRRPSIGKTNEFRP